MSDVPAGAGQWGVLKVSAVHTNGFRPSENKAIGSATALIDPRYEVHPGDLLFSRANTPELVGAACLATDTDELLMLSDKTLRLVLDPDRADARFVNICLASPSVRRQIGLGSSGSSRSMQNISQRALGKLLLKWPTLKDQRQIVEVMESVAESERAEMVELNKLKTIRRTLIEGLALCECFPMAEIIVDGPKNGIYKSEDQYGGSGTPIVRINSFEGGPSDLTRNLLRVKVAGDEVRRYAVSVGDILINRVNAPGLVGKSTMVASIHEPTLFESNIMRCRFDASRMNPKIIEAWLSGSVARSHFAARTKPAVSQASINRSDVLSCPIPEMDSDMQAEFLERLEALDSLVDEIRLRVVKLKNLRAGLAEDLLGGREYGRNSE
ncbi:restriction endonuclease subunit S [Streptomyces argenteolus]|uniref:restriction endonuclease subunit S n=1 Tax=Streptomyces sp. NPDC025273 TaxID=3155251 RepID=UPI0033F72D53